MKNLGWVIAFFVIILDLIPATISFLMIRDGKNTNRITWRSLLAEGMCVAIHLSSYMLIHKVFFGHWNFLNAIRDAKTLDFTYQEIMYFPVSLTARSAMAFVVGWCLRMISTAETKRPAKSFPKQQNFR